MAKGYWIAFYRSISDPAALAAYAKLAGPAVIANGGRYLARADAVKAYEQGIAQRTVVTEFDSVEQAIAAHDSPAYQAALKALGNACERDCVSSLRRLILSAREPIELLLSFTGPIVKTELVQRPKPRNDTRAPVT